jgi:hypothetical protein
MYTNHLENINFPFEAGTLVTYRANGWFPVQTLVVTKATFHHPVGVTMHGGSSSALTPRPARWRRCTATSSPRWLGRQKKI